MWTLYFLNVLFSLEPVFDFVVFLSIVMIALGCMGAIFDDEIGQMFHRQLRKSIIVGLICFALTALIPSKKEAFTIYMIPKIVNNQQIKELPENALKYLNTYFKEEIKEFTKEEEK